LSEGDKEEVIEACRELTNTVYDGLDLAGEIRAIDTQELGDTLLLWDDARLVGFAACHYGARTEAGSGACYIKFGVTRPGHNAGENFERLLDACEALAATLGAQVLTAGANMGRYEAYRAMRRGIPHRHPRRRDAAIERYGLQCSWRLHHRRLALTVRPWVSENAITGKLGFLEWNRCYVGDAVYLWGIGLPLTPSAGNRAAIAPEGEGASNHRRSPMAQEFLR
jgi:hypothetical protein